MKRMPFLFAGILGALLVLGIACGGAAAPTATKAPPPKATATPTRPAVTRPAVAPTATPTAPGPAAGATLEIASPGADAKFDKNKLTAKTGSVVVLRFTNNSTAWPQHNWVLVKPGTKDGVANDGAAAASNDYVKPGDDRVIAFTKQIKQGQTGDVTFTAPPPGTYQYVCTFPAHNALGMFGEFTATP